MRSFSSDNASGVHPAVMDALLAANADHAPAYGADRWTEGALGKFRDIFGPDVTALFVFGGTAANVLAVAPLLESYQAVICPAFSHLHVDECGAAETFTGCKLITVEVDNAKLTAEAVRPHLDKLGDVHAVQPKVISITQANEFGMIYSPDDVRALCEFAHGNGLLVHMDGARLANAAAAMNVDLREASRDLGVDVLSFGGTKNGLMYGEAVLFFNAEHSRTPPFFRKKLGQLASKMRFIAAQFDAYLTDDIWLYNALHANAMARELAGCLEDLPGIEVTRPVQTNMVWARTAPPTSGASPKAGILNTPVPQAGEERFVASFDTTPDDIRELVETLKGA